MDTSATPVSGLPPLPPGATMASAPTSSSALPPLPPGASLTTPPAAAAAPTNPSTASRVGSALYGLPGVQEGVGMVKGGMHTVAGLLQLFGTPDETMMKAAGVQNSQNMVEPHIKAAADWLNAHAQDHGMWQHIGDFGESALELMTPEALASLGKVEEAAKAGEAATKLGEVAGKAQQLSDASKVAQLLDKFPRVKALVMIGARAAARGGAEVGGQTLVKTGGDVDAAKSAAVQGAAVGGILAPIVGGVQMARAAYAAKAGEAADTLTKYHQAKADYHQQVADRQMQTDQAKADWQAKTDAAKADWQAANAKQDAEHAAAMEQHRNALIDRQTQIAKAREEWKSALDQQAQSHAAAVDAYEKQVGERTAQQEQARATWKSQLDEQAKQHAADVAEYQQKLAEHQQKVGALQSEATNSLKAQRQIEAQQGIRNTAKDAAEDAITRFNTARGPGVEPVDAAAAKQSVSSFGDTAEAIRDAAAPVYDKINAATKGKFAELQATRSAAIRAQDFAESDKAEAKINSLLEKNPGVTPQEYAAARSAWHDSKDFDRIHNAVEGAFNGISEDMAAQPGTGARIVKGDALQGRLGSLLRGSKAFSPERLESLVGKDGMVGLYRAAHLTSTPELRSATQQLVREVAEQLRPPEVPVKPSAPPAPEPLPKPIAPVRPEAPERPAVPPKPVAPVRPAPIERPAPLARPEPLPRPVAPTPPVRPSSTATLAKAIGYHTAEGIAGLIIGHATGIPYAYSIGGVAATRYIMRQIVENPKIGQMAQYAVDYGASPKNAAKIIATMIQQNETENSNQRKAAEATQ